MPVESLNFATLVSDTASQGRSPFSTGRPEREVIYIVLNDSNLVRFFHRSLESLRISRYGGTVRVLTNLPPDEKLWLRDDRRFGLVSLKATDSVDGFGGKTVINKYANAVKTIILDCDTLVLGALEPLWDALDRSDLAVCPDIMKTLGRAIHSDLQHKPKYDREDMEKTLRLCGPDAPYFNCGVIAFRKSKRCDDFFAQWHKEWAIAKSTDQYAFLRTLKQTGLPVQVLGTEFNCPCQWVTGIQDARARGIRILHFFGDKQAMLRDDAPTSPAVKPPPPPQPDSPAVISLRKRVHEHPTNPAAHRDLGSALVKAGKTDEAIAAFRRSIEFKRDDIGVFDQLAACLRSKKREKELLRCWQVAVEFNPDNATAHDRLGGAFLQLERVEEAITSWRKAIELKPDLASAHNNLGAALARLSRFDEAGESYRRAIELEPGFIGAHCNLGNSHQKMGRLDDAMACYNRAKQIDPRSPGAHWNHGLALLGKGDLLAGFIGYEWRWQCKDLLPPPRKFKKPRWDGSRLDGKTIFLWAEQGFGDTIQFVRYVSQVVGQGGRIVLECQGRLKDIMGSVAGISQVIAAGEKVPDFDTHLPLMSLPYVLRTTTHTVPTRIPYLHVPRKLIAETRAKFGKPDGTLKVGISWAGRPQHKEDHLRSMTLQHLAPLADVPNVTFVTLQKGDPARQMDNPPLGMLLANIRNANDSFINTAALMQNLDLIITVDTAVAHLAGAFGRPVWVILAYSPDWRWKLQGDRTPWYPSMRLFRQKTSGDWPSAIAQVREALAKLPTLKISQKSA